MKLDIAGPRFDAVLDATLTMMRARRRAKLDPTLAAAADASTRHLDRLLVALEAHRPAKRRAR